MKSKLVLLTVIISTQAAFFDNETSMEFHQRQTKLISRLFSEYRKDVPPISTRGRYSSVTIKPMVVNITLAYAKLLSVNEPNQSVDMIVEYNLNWNDARLTWNPTDFDEIEGFLINRELIWRVDLMPYDSSSVVDIRDPNVQHAYVNSNGDIEFYVASVVSFSCPLNVKAFPFDKQVCEVNFVSYNFGSNELQINAEILKNYNEIDASNGEWTVDKLTAAALPSIEGASNYDIYVATFTFHFRRSSAFYIILIIMPSFVLTFLCVFGLFWSRFDQTDYLEKLGLGFAAILAMCTILEITEESVPKTRQLPSLSIYIMINLLLLTMAISIVVMASKTCSLSLDMSRILSKRWLHRFDLNLCARFQIICLVLFPLETIANLLALVSNV